MRTVKEISDLTGISVRTLHYYDEIGLLKPTEKSDAGYRLYDDKALETLQQVLFFREFDIPLKEIKAVMDNPVLERNQLLQMQRKMLVAKKERMERLITSIDDILKGENKMDFAIFSKTEVEEMFQTMLEHMPDNMKELAIKEFGSAEAWRGAEQSMAVIKAVSSKAGIGHAIDYVTKKEKTEEKLVSGLHCEPETVKEEMQATKELWGKTDGRTYKHYVQSYHEDEEITPEQAHKNAVELAEHTKAWKGHEVLIATHIDKGHIHTHFIVNSVNYENGHKLQWM